METKTPVKFPLQKELLDLLKNLVPLHSVYVIDMDTSKNKHIYYLHTRSKEMHPEAIYTLLIVGQKALHKGLDDLMEEVYDKMGQRCKVHVIYCEISNLMERIDIGDNFLTRTLKEAPCMYREDNALSRYGQYGLMYHLSLYKEIETCAMVTNLELKSKPTNNCSKK